MKTSGKFLSAVACALVVLGVMGLTGCGSNEQEAADQQAESSVEAVAESNSETTESATETDAVASDSSTAAADDEISPEFRESMDGYEAFFDEYVEYMKKAAEDPTNTEVLMGMSDMITKGNEMRSEFDAIADEDLSVAEKAYYLEVQARIMAKLSEVG